MTRNNQEPCKVAVTGGIGSGKSTVLAMIWERGYRVLSCDDLAREVTGEPRVLEALRARFGAEIAGETLDRRALAARVFGDSAALAQLNEIVHAGVFRRLREEFASCKEKVIFVEIQLLFETHSEDLFDQIVVVMRGREERIRAVAARNGLTREEVSARIQSQFDYENLPKNAHTVIYNDSGLGELEKKVTVLLDDIQAKI